MRYNEDHRYWCVSDPGSSPGARGGGGDGDFAAAPIPATRLERYSPPPRSTPPPEWPDEFTDKFTYNPSAGSSGGGGGDGDGAPEPPSTPPRSPFFSDDEDYEVFSNEELAEFEKGTGTGSLFMSDPKTDSMFSDDPRDLFQYIGRQNCVPLSTEQFFSLRHKWQLLLDGKKTYLRPPKNNPVAFANCLFVTPKPLERALGYQEPLSVFVHEAAENSIIQEKFKILSNHYVSFRQMRVDGSSFYRAFLFSYLENLGKMHDSQAEVTCLMECVARSREDLCCLQWNNAYFSNPEAFFSSLVSEFEHLVNSVANGLNADELYERSLQEITSSRKVHIRSHYEEYKPAVRQCTEALKYCIKHVRPVDAEAEMLPMRALSNVFGIPLHVSLVDATENNGIVQVKCFDLVPQSELRLRRTSGPHRPSYYLSSTTDKHPQQGRDGSNSVMPAGNLLPSDHMPLVTLLSRTGQFDILYRK